MADPSDRLDEVERLFVEFLRQGPGADLEAWCREHPTQAPRLRAMHESLRAVRAWLREAGQSPSAFLAGATPRLRPGSSPSSDELLRRIVAQGPKGSRFRLQGEIARGGMGAILRVHDDDLGRDLAMKVVLGRDGGSQPGSDVDERMLVRFLEEAQITGQLEHPGVVPVHELGLDDDGRVYFTMRLVKGRDLAAVFDLVERGEQGWTRTRALNVLLRVCEAMAYAHSRGVVHRDLKPANVMVGRFGEVYVMDWGLAHTEGGDLPSSDSESDAVHTARAGERQDASDSSMATLQGDVLGTPAYMPPEQARGRHDLLTAQADVYALGAMLYHLLTGHMPFSGPDGTRSPREVLGELLKGPPTPLRELCRDLPPELEAITEKAMAREASARYADMSELGEDLRAYLEGRVVRAHQTGAWVELRKWVARNRALAGAAAAALVFLVAGLAASLWQRGVALENATLAAERAEEAREQGELAEARAVEAAAAARRAETARDFLAELLADANPVNTMQSELMVADVLSGAVERLDAGAFADDPESEYALRGTLGDAFQGVSLLEDSERQYRRALEVFELRAEGDPLERIALTGDLDDTLIVRGKHEEVERSTRARLAELDDLGIGDHAQRVRALKQLAQARYNQGDTPEALASIGEALAISARLFGEDDPVTARTRGKHAFYLSRAGRLDEALAEADRAIASLEGGSLLDRYEATEAMRTRSRIHASRRENQAALSDLQRGLEIRRELFSGDGLQVANFEADIGIALNVVGRGEEGEPLLRHALEIRRRVLGDHADTATVMTTLAALLTDRGDLAAAGQLQREALEMRVRVLGTDSPAVGDSKVRLGELALREGDPARAEVLLRQGIAILEPVIGPEHPDVASARSRLGRALRALGRLDEARVELERALEVQEALFGIDNSVSRDTRDEWYRLLLEQGDHETVLTALGEARARMANQVGPMAAYLGALQGAALTGLGRYEEAEPLLLEGWRVMGPDQRLWAVNKLAVLDALIDFYVAIEDEAEADRYRALAAELR